ncbi:PREDICTED: TBC1 domain family member 2B isoform X2 [Nanorana parkeri]|uniref:TBC1 domain family member 2B isoform X2 n=1 Tax=Nanorana parkeri TaxID=125878 RepID=UPI000854C19B|nr:PREDICTED: TBC1 domain family member 2B isoform X2 [Nanorana parkeri]
MPGVEDRRSSQDQAAEDPMTSSLTGEATKEPAAKLCGNLAKLSGKGPLRSFKNRWFVFDPRKCYLYYFKSPNDAQSLGYIDIGDASFSYDMEVEEGQFEIRSSGRVSILRASNRQAMAYWLQELQQKRWEYCNVPGTSKRDSILNTVALEGPAGLVAKENNTSVPNVNDAAERARNHFAVEMCPGVLGDQTSDHSSGHTAAVQGLLRQWSNDIRNSVQNFRPGRSGHETRKSTFYTNEEWELLNPTVKELEESLLHEERKRPSMEAGQKNPGMVFPFDFPRLPAKVKRPLSHFNKNSSILDNSPVESVPGNDSKVDFDLQLKLQNQQGELERLRQELNSQKELVKLLQQSLRSSQYDKYHSIPFSDGPSKDYSTLLQQKDDQIQELNHLLERKVQEEESPHHQTEDLKHSMENLKEQLNMMMETIQAKDEVIIRLSRQISDYEQLSPLSSKSSESLASSHKDQEELSRLQDSLQGYKAQNKFLNKEILELSALRRNSEKREDELEAKYSTLEAKMCQIESKYLVLLQEMKTPVCSDEQGPARDMVNQLLEDALKVETAEHTFIRPHAMSKHDLYGFQILPEDEDEEERLVAKVRALDIRSLSLSDNQEISTVVKWENYFASMVNREMGRSPELKSLVRNGIPHQHRSKMWKLFVNQHIKKLKDEVAPDYFDILLRNALEKQNPASKQIELDLMRTLPDNKHYTSPTSEGIQKLRNVLLAYSWRNPDIGYCQGLNRLAAIALLYLDQEDAFWCLVTIVEVFMPRDYYTKTLLGSQVDQRVFKDLMSEKLPRLSAHFEQYNVDSTLITFNWFLVVFVDSVVSDIFFRIWDSFLYEGSKVIFRFALGLFKYKEEEILKIQDSTSIFKYLRYFSRTILDARKLGNIAFVDMNPFPLRQIRNRRTYHLEKVRLELSELEAIRADFIRERETNPERRDLISDDDEDG